MTDEVLEALEQLLTALDANEDAVRAIRARGKTLHRRRNEGEAWSSIVAAENHPLIIESLREMQERLRDAGVRFRRAEARALRAEGLTFDQIASLFGVTRQRVIQLVNDH